MLKFGKDVCSKYRIENNVNIRWLNVMCDMSSIDNSRLTNDALLQPIIIRTIIFNVLTRSTLTNKDHFGKRGDLYVHGNE